MKKIYSFFMSLTLCCMILTSCDSVSSKADHFTKAEMEAASNLDFEKVSEIEAEETKYLKSLSESDQEKYEQARLKAIAKYSKKYEKAAKKATEALDGMFGAIQDLTDDAANDDSDRDDDSADDDSDRDDDSDDEF